MHYYEHRLRSYINEFKNKEKVSEDNKNMFDTANYHFPCGVQ